MLVENPCRYCRGQILDRCQTCPETSIEIKQKGTMLKTILGILYVMAYFVTLAIMTCKMIE